MTEREEKGLVEKLTDGLTNAQQATFVVFCILGYFFPLINQASAISKKKL